MQKLFGETSLNCKAIICSILITSALYGCQNNNPETIQLTGFSTISWRNDSLGCLGYRQDLALQLKSSFSSKIAHKNKEALTQLLGEPNTQHSHMGNVIYAYFVKKDRQCFDSLWRQHGSSDAEQILFTIDNKGEVIGFTGPIYP